MAVWFVRALLCIKSGFVIALPRFLLPIFALASNPIERLVAVRANGRIVSDYGSALKDDAHWYLTAAFFTNNRITLPKVDPIVYLGREYYPLDAVAGLTFSVNTQEQILNIKIPATAFGRSLLNASRRARYEPTVSSPGMFFNHDVQYLTGNNLNQFSGLFEVGMFSQLGVCTSEFSAVNHGSAMSLTRIETLFTRDSPNHMATLLVGDTLSLGEMWARPVYFAGLRYIRNFAVQPAFILEVLPGVNGVVVQPSVVDIYADNIKLLSQSVDAGPFAIQNIPVMSGQGGYPGCSYRRTWSLRDHHSAICEIGQPFAKRCNGLLL
jgi:outer membrane usher protein